MSYKDTWFVFLNFFAKEVIFFHKMIDWSNVKQSLIDMYGDNELIKMSH